jgi:hypothetical protein
LSFSKLLYIFIGKCYICRDTRQPGRGKSPLIEVDQVYEKHHFKILKAKSLYRPVDGSLMIQFKVFTQMQVVPDPPNTFPAIVYRLKDFGQIDDLAGQTENFIGIK